MSVYPKHVTHVSLQLYTQLCLQELMRWLSWLKVLAAKPGDPCSIPETYVVAGKNLLLHLSSNSHMHIISPLPCTKCLYTSHWAPYSYNSHYEAATHHIGFYTFHYRIYFYVLIYHPNQKVCDRLRTRKTAQSGLELTLYPRMASNLQSYCHSILSPLCQK